MPRRKRHKKHEEHVDESWLLPYADLLTLLLALFIVLFASSSVDQVKFQNMSQVFTDIFSGGENVLDYASLIPKNENEDQSNPIEGASAETLDMTEQQRIIEEFLKEQADLESAIAQDQAELLAIQRAIDAYIEQNNLSDQFATKLTDEGLLLTIRDSVLFSSGSASVQESYKSVAEEVARLLEFDPPRNVIISGHTDNVPIGNAAFSSNWELSVMRAVNFMKLVIDNPALDPRWFSAKGFGEFQPIAPNDSEDGRARNRRVEILILPRV
ncbi:flagellar motor protein MotB [Jeotgalibacillus proteolyticus]|uniref:Flagellar motor protein MotB n=1 Tax=Jeotgalibacillus proteolyticus TaxID=2082395 RepID=A0A2S5G7A3_9BACL|nr:flagellar motor protein MotB [Jeotgalibacillus proteolyticus]PPA68862.1 flagellar motor protein MotB [Jeotgalibacillus proteolyticus]